MESTYVSENTVSLNADFLKFLSDKRSTAAAAAATSSQTRKQHVVATGGGANAKVSLTVDAAAHDKNTHSTTPFGMSRGRTPGTEGTEGGRATKTFSVTEIEQAEKTMNENKGLTKVPTEVQQWNEYLKQK